MCSIICLSVRPKGLALRPSQRQAARIAFFALGETVVPAAMVVLLCCSVPGPEQRRSRALFPAGQNL
jgi:hypothetical protein